MKKIMYLATALLVMASCNNKNEADMPEQGEAFTKGQKVTIICGSDNVKAPVRNATGIANAQNDIEFKWEDGDELTITVSGQEATFTLETGAGTNSATFTGIMPASGETFTAEYKGEYWNAVSDYSQTYNANSIDKRFIYAKAEDCTVSSQASGSISECDLVMQHVVMCIPLLGDTLVSKIRVYPSIPQVNAPAHHAPSRQAVNGGWEEILLECSTDVRLNTTTATPFYVILPVDWVNGETTINVLKNTNGYETYISAFVISGVTAGEVVKLPNQKWLDLDYTGYVGNWNRWNMTNFTAVGEQAKIEIYGSVNKNDTAGNRFKFTGDLDIWDVALHDLTTGTVEKTDGDNDYTFEITATDYGQSVYYDIWVKFRVKETSFQQSFMASRYKKVE